MAETAGCHFFKCPLCNNSKEFSDEMQQFGIYLPDQDAKWETGDGFDDQLQRHDRCDSEACLCPSGPKYDEEDTIWEIMLCVCCGSQVKSEQIYTFEQLKIYLILGDAH